MNMNIFIDCGAPSLYNYFSRKKHKKRLMGSYFHERKYDDFSFTDTEDYKNYLESYVQFLKENKHKGYIYPNLDVINNPKKTKENQEYLESHGLSPIPVWHLGSDYSYLVDYVKKYEYIAIGGMTPNPTSVLLPMLDSLWKEYLIDEEGYPIVKVHGFAMTSISIITRYPWYSVDSTRWGKEASFGRILCPYRNKGKWVYDKNVFIIAVSSRSPLQKKDNEHILTLKPKTRQIILDYISEKGYSLGKSVFKYESSNYQLKENEKFTGVKIDNKKEIEIIEEEGLSNSYDKRGELNLLFFADLQKAIPEWPWKFKLKRNKQKGLLE